ncbi:MAG: ThiF family adenylyltransferase [Planctomycetaceae bacterium]|nr:ThiF family adenylyltransferase [Planctomycetaceae bacterium]
MTTRSLHDRRVAVIGATSIGRQVCLQLAALSVKSVRLVGSGIVTTQDVDSGGYRSADIGLPKVDAVGDACHQANPQLDFVDVSARASLPSADCEIVFCCASSALERRRAWAQLKSFCRLWIDAQAHTDIAQFLIAYDQATKHRYQSLFDDRWVYIKAGRRAPLVPVSAVAAGVAVYQFVSWTQGLELPAMLKLDLRSAKLNQFR